jgi:hypothetical protein
MNEAEIQILCERLGDPVGGFYRTHFLSEGVLEAQEGDLTLVFRSGKTVRLTGTPHGYDLSVDFQRNGEPYDGAVDFSNLAESDEHGKLVEFCLNDEPDWQSLIGQPLTAVGRLIFTEHSEPCGVSLRFPGDRVVLVHDLIDEVIVQQTAAPPWLAEQPICSEVEPRPARESTRH